MWKGNCESGGGNTHTGNAIIVAGENGEHVRPLFLPHGYALGIHAIFVIKRGMYIVETRHSRSNESATVWRVVGIGEDWDPNELILRWIGGYENGDGNFPAYLQAAVDAALDKAHCYHCRCVHYVAK